MIWQTWAEALKKYNALIAVAFIFFPILSNLVTHASSIFLAAFVLAGLPLLFIARRIFSPLKTHEKWVMAAFVAYTVAYLVSFMVNAISGTLNDPRLSYVDHEIRFLALIPVFFLFRHVKITQSSIWLSIVAGSWLSGGYALIHYFWLNPGERVTGSYHPIAFGDLAIIFAFLSIPAFDFYKNKSKFSYLALIIALISGVIASILSGTRGAWIAIPVLAVILFVYLTSKYKPLTRMLCFGVMVLILFAVYHSVTQLAAERIDAAAEQINSYRSGNRAYTSISTRIEAWHAALDIFMEHPIIGAGPGSYPLRLKQLVAQGKPYKNAMVHKQPHSAYLSTMADTGLIGVSALLFVFLAPFWAAIRIIRLPKVRHIGFALILLVAGFMHFGITETIFSRNVNLNFYLVMIAAFMAVTTNEMESDTPDH